MDGVGSGGERRRGREEKLQLDVICSMGNSQRTCTPEEFLGPLMGCFSNGRVLLLVNLLLNMHLPLIRGISRPGPMSPVI